MYIQNCAWSGSFISCFSMYLNGRDHWFGNGHQDQRWDNGEGELNIQKYKSINYYIYDMSSSLSFI
jgi:hypothetical protein